MDNGSSQYMVMGISWSRDPQGFQHNLAECWASLPMGEGVDICCMYIIWAYMLMNVGSVMFGKIIA